MRPIKALVLSIDKQAGIKIRLESGLLATLPYNKNKNVGQTIHVTFNFTKKQVVGAINTYKEENMPTPTKTDKGDVDNDPENPELIEALLA
ncbi:hypothetical protein KAW18_04000 [candidate division WOR-3 bacterium]|nr:hypothetical protein [candidate division WOR-3 bacterium]